MIQIREEIEIHGPAEPIFSAIVDFSGYDRWLTPSSAYRGLTDVSSDPIRLGTTWSEPAPTGVRHGTVSEFDPPDRVTFHQPMSLRPKLLGVIDITVAMDLTQSASSTRVRRRVTLELPWSLKPIRPYVVRQFRAEGARTLRALRDFIERE